MFAKATVSKYFILASIAILTFFSGSRQTLAATDTCTWTGAVDTSWSNGGNWTGCDNGGVPENGDVLSFISNGAPTSSVNDIAGFTAGGIAVSGGNYTISGLAISIEAANLIVSGGTLTVDLDVEFPTNNVQVNAFSATTITFNSGRTVTISGTNLIATNGGTIHFNGNVAGSGNLSIAMTGSGSVYLANDIKTYLGETYVNGGRLIVDGGTSGNDGMLGNSSSATYVSNGTSLIFMNGASTYEPISAVGIGSSGIGAIRQEPNGVSTISSNITLIGNTRMVGLGDLYFTGNINCAGFVLTLVGNITVGGNINGATAVQTNTSSFAPNTASLTLYGNVNSSGGFTAVGGSFYGDTIFNNTFYASSGVSPVDFNPNGLSIGTMTFNTLVMSNPGQVLNMQFAGAVTDQIIANNITLNDAVLNMNLAGAAPAVGQTFTIVDNQGANPVNGRFTGLPNSGDTFSADGVNFSINYAGGDGNDVVVTVESGAPVNNSPTISINSIIGSNLCTLPTVCSTNEGIENTMNLTFGDADSDPIALTINWGDGTIENFNYTGDTSYTADFTHTYVDDNPTGTASDDYTISVSVSDGIAEPNNYSMTETVFNAEPAINNISIPGGGGEALVQQPFSLSFDITDAGVEDSFEVDIDWGDGITSNMTLPAGTISISRNHVYANVGMYEIQVVLTDDDGGQTSFSRRVNVAVEPQQLAQTGENASQFIALALSILTVTGICSAILLRRKVLKV